jgi:hypothetical protein
MAKRESTTNAVANRAFPAQKQIVILPCAGKIGAEFSGVIGSPDDCDPWAY